MYDISFHVPNCFFFGYFGWRFGFFGLLGFSWVILVVFFVILGYVDLRFVAFGRVRFGFGGFGLVAIVFGSVHSMFGAFGSIERWFGLVAFVFGSFGSWLWLFAVGLLLFGNCCGSFAYINLYRSYIWCSRGCLRLFGGHFWLLGSADGIFDS